MILPAESHTPLDATTDASALNNTRDLYSKHPTKSDLWTYRGRIDNIVVCVNGEKINPVTIEDQVGSHPAVKSAPVAGQGRFYAALLVEPIQPVHTTAERAQLLGKIWPSVENANAASPAYGRISKAHTLFIKPEKPTLRAGEGTVQRRLPLNAYADERDTLYADAESFMAGESTSPVHVFDTSSLESLILRLVQNTSRHPKSMDSNNDFFSRGGIDSLQVLQLVR